MVMLTLVAYGVCLGLGLVIVVLLFALSIACLVTDEVSLQPFRHGKPRSAANMARFELMPEIPHSRDKAVAITR